MCLYVACACLLFPDFCFFLMFKHHNDAYDFLHIYMFLHKHAIFAKLVYLMDEKYSGKHKINKNNKVLTKIKS